jgi:hypothetical protein
MKIGVGKLRLLKDVVQAKYTISDAPCPKSTAYPVRKPQGAAELNIDLSEKCSKCLNILDSAFYVGEADAQCSANSDIHLEQGEAH